MQSHQGALHLGLSGVGGDAADENVVSLYGSSKQRQRSNKHCDTDAEEEGDEEEEEENTVVARQINILFHGQLHQKKKNNSHIFPFSPSTFSISSSGRQKGH